VPPFEGDLPLDGVGRARLHGQPCHPSRCALDRVSPRRLAANLHLPKLFLVGEGDGEFEKPAGLVRGLAQAVMLEQAQAGEALVKLPFKALKLRRVFREGALELQQRGLPGSALTLGLSRRFSYLPSTLLPRRWG